MPWRFFSLPRRLVGARAERRSEARREIGDVLIASPLMEAQLVDASGSGLGIEVSAELRVGVIYPFRLHHGDEMVEVYAIARWCAGAARSPFRAGLSVVRWDTEPSWLAAAP